MPSTVVIPAPSASTANIVQAFTAAPLNNTVQAPQYVVSQPMCVPKRSSPSLKNPTSNKRGSTSREYSLPLTFTRTATLALSGIQVTHLHLFATRAAHGRFNGALDQRTHDLSLVFG